MANAPKIRFARINEDQANLAGRLSADDWGILAAREAGGGTVGINLATSGVAYTQNFDSLASTGTSSTLPTDWFISETGTNANGTYAAGTGSGTAGETYSFGAAASSDRALGMIQSGTNGATLLSSFGATFTNTTGGTITSLLIAYTGEQWRLGTTGRADRIDFQISFDATSLTTGTWFDIDQLDFSSPFTTTAGALDGNATANRTAISFNVTTVNGNAVNIANNGTFWIRWNDFNATGADDGLSVDDFSLTPTASVVPTPGTLAIDNVTLAEGNSGPTAFTFTVTRSGGSSGVVGATWTLVPPGGAGANAADFDSLQPLTGTVSFADGDTSENITILVNGDLVVEGNEAFTVVLSAASGGATITDDTGDGSITNDDVAAAPGQLSIGDVTLAEGNSGTTAFTFTVIRTGGSDGAVSATWTLDAPGGATLANSADFDGSQASSGTVSFANGETSKTITILVLGDVTFEDAETFLVTLSAPMGGATLGNANGTGTILNDDPAPAGTLSVNDVSLGEGDIGSTTTFTFTVSRSGGSAGTVAANWAISAPGGAGNASNDDFVSGAIFAGTVSFGNGETSKTITIDVEGDVDFEADEAFTVTLSGATGGAGIGDGTGAGTILNDDLQPPAGSVGIADATIVEGDAGTQILVLTLTRIGGTGAFAVNYATSNVALAGQPAATAPSDYLAASGTVNFAAGQNIATVQITINGDTLSELDEQFTVTLSGATNGATISDATAIATITSDDPEPTATRIFEEDFTGFTAGGFAPNPTPTQIDSDIWRVVGLSDIANPAYGFTATTGDFARGTIGSNDPTTAGVYSPTSNPALIVQPTGAELDINGFIEAKIENLSGSTATGFDIAFDWAYRNSGNRASSLVFSYSTDGTNFTAVPAAAFTTPDTAVTVTDAFALQHEIVSLTGLSVAAGQFVYLRWTHASSAGGGNRDEVGIDNLTVDATGGAVGPRVSVSDVSVNEAAGTMTFTITRANAHSGAFTIGYETANGTATAGADYVATSGTLSFAENQASATLTVTINNEGTPELDETVLLNLVNPTGAIIADGQGVGTIVNDDGAPIQVSINDVSIVEGHSGTQNLVFTVTRTGGSGAFDVNFETQDGTAISTFGDPSRDYVTTSGTINFIAGQNTATISVPIFGDTLPEPNQSFQLLLTSATNNAIIVDGTGVGTIVNDEPIFIHDIQGAGYFSPILLGDGITSFNIASTTMVTVRAVVTAVDNVGNRQGYYLQEEITDADANIFTSEAIFVMTRNDSGVGNVVSGVSVGDLVQVSANVMEYQAFSSMPRTMLVNSTGLSIISTGNVLPPAMVLTNMPNEVLTDVTPDYVFSTNFGDALGYWESLEGMLVTIPNMVVADGFVSTSGGDPFLQAYSLDSANADQINSRGGYTIAGDPPIGPPDTAATGDDTIHGGRHLHDGDVNPDIIELDFTDFAMAPPTGLLTGASMGDLLGDVTGIVDFDFTDRKLFVTAMEPGGFVDGGSPTQEVTALGDDGRSLTVATFNVENLDPTDGAARFTALANAIANNLNAPDIICIEEMQDNNGGRDSSDPPTQGEGDGASPTGTDASQSWQMLVDALNLATGSNYQWVDELPTYNAEGGQDNGNIRVGFLYNTDRVQLGDLDANATITERRAYTDRIGDNMRDPGDLIAFSDNMVPGEINPGDWGNTRRSLLGEFTFNGNTVYVTANHWPAKGGSGDFWQFNQNLDSGQPINSGWTGRNAVAQDVYAVLNMIQSANADAGIVAGGDFNDFYFYRPLTTVTGYTMADGTARVGGARFDNLTLTLSEAERYTYTFDGRSQAIDHIIVNSLLSGVATYDVVHLNTGFNPTGSPALSDHDPGLSSFDYRNFSEEVTGTNGNDSINGFGGADLLDGGAGADYLDGGGGGIDVLRGGSGDDALIVDADDLVEEAVGGGFDNVAAKVSYLLNTGAEVEILSTTNHGGTAAINLGGNEFGQTLIGNAGNNYIDGGGGLDVLVGLGGDDALIVDSDDRLVEAVGGGFDNVGAKANYVLEAGQEVEVLSTTDHGGTAAINLTGNAFSQSVIGNAGANVLDGKGGNDLLVGLGGADTFAFTTALGGGNVDAINDFVSGTDKIALDDAIFTGLGLGALPAGAFVAGTQAGDADDRIIYNSANGQILFDADGNGAGAAILFATLQPGTALVAGDFQVI